MLTFKTVAQVLRTCSLCQGERCLRATVGREAGARACISAPSLSAQVLPPPCPGPGRGAPAGFRRRRSGSRRWGLTPLMLGGKHASTSSTTTFPPGRGGPRVSAPGYVRPTACGASCTDKSAITYYYEHTRRTLRNRAGHGRDDCSAQARKRVRCVSECCFPQAYPSAVARAAKTIFRRTSSKGRHTLKTTPRTRSKRRRSARPLPEAPAGRLSAGPPDESVPGCRHSWRAP